MSPNGGLGINKFGSNSQNEFNKYPQNLRGYLGEMTGYDYWSLSGAIKQTIEDIKNFEYGIKYGTLVSDFEGNLGAFAKLHLFQQVIRNLSGLGLRDLEFSFGESLNKYFKLLLKELKLEEKECFSILFGYRGEELQSKIIEGFLCYYVYKRLNKNQRYGIKEIELGEKISAEIFKLPKHREKVSSTLQIAA